MAQVLVVKYENQADAKVFETHMKARRALPFWRYPLRTTGHGRRRVAHGSL